MDYITTHHFLYQLHPEKSLKSLFLKYFECFSESSASDCFFFLTELNRCRNFQPRENFHIESEKSHNLSCGISVDFAKVDHVRNR